MIEYSKINCGSQPVVKIHQTMARIIICLNGLHRVFENNAFMAM